MGIGKDAIWISIIGVLILALIYMMVRPGSPATKAIQAISDALTGMVKVATNNFGGNNG